MPPRTVLLSALLLLATVPACNNDLVCPTGESDCGGRCVALHNNHGNCGACGHACGALEECSDAACTTCAADVVQCEGVCTDTRIDPTHCGDCGTTCGGATPLCDGDGAGCVASGACPAGESECAGGCVDFQRHPRHCGACGHACAPGESCRTGECRADTYVACYWTNEVKPVTLALGYGGPSIGLGTSRPASLALDAANLYVASGQPQASLSIVPLAGGAPTTVTLPGYDLNTVLLQRDVLLVTNSAVGTLEILGLDGKVLDEIPMPDQQNYPNPHGVAVVGSNAYVALNSTQQIAKIDLSQLAACSAPDPDASACGVGGACAAGRRCVAGTCKLECGHVAGVIDLTNVAGAVDGNALPLPSAVTTDGTRVFVTLSNLEWSHVDCDGFSYEWWALPAGPGRLAVIDTADADAVSIVTLGAGCKSPSDVTLWGTKLWVSCGAYCFPEVAPGALVQVDLAGGDPAVGVPLPLGATIAGRIAFCAGQGYVTDQRKTGAVVRFDPSTGIVEPPVELCGADVNGNALAADIVCTE
jgi:hypothetical protein